MENKRIWAMVGVVYKDAPGNGIVYLLLGIGCTLAAGYTLIWGILQVIDQFS